ncbi:MAG: hypothetical protein KAV82_13315, partial [Phycisphaerae bacterium]|nr:hypothetical protein [Phycisphaerae bacterium]
RDFGPWTRDLGLIAGAVRFARLRRAPPTLQSTWAQRLHVCSAVFASAAVAGLEVAACLLVA